MLYFYVDCAGWNYRFWKRQSCISTLLFSYLLVQDSGKSIIFGFFTWMVVKVTSKEDLVKPLGVQQVQYMLAIHKSVSEKNTRQCTYYVNI